MVKKGQNRAAATLGAIAMLAGVSSAYAVPLPVDLPLPAPPALPPAPVPVPPAPVPSLAPPVPAPGTGFPAAPLPRPAVPAPRPVAPVVQSPRASGGTAAPITVPSAGTPAARGAAQGSAPAPAAPGASGAGTRGGASSAQREPSSRRLRKELRRYSGCVRFLPLLERRVIVLRAGLDGRKPRDRRQIAARYDLSIKRVGRIERQALRRLRGGCASRSLGTPTSASAPARTGFFASSAVEPRGIGATPSASAPAREGAGSADAKAVKGVTDSGPEPAREVQAEPMAPAVAAATYLRDGNGPAHTFLVIGSLLAAIASAVLIVREFRKVL